MVLPLKEIIKAMNEDESSVKGVLSSFHAIKSKNKEEVEDFLRNKAFSMELGGQSVTYLIVDENAENNVILGYFTLAVKVFQFGAEISNRQRRKLSGKIDDFVPAFLIGQLARSEDTIKGTGKEFLKIAISYIKAAANLVGGRLVYIDCIDEFVEYYIKNQFRYLQKNEENGLSQLYLII